MMNTEYQPVNSLQVVAFIVKFCKANDIPLNITKLQKLMYCCYGVVLAKTGLRLTDEHPEAWQYGPVFPDALKCVQFFDIDGFKDSNSSDIDKNPRIKELIEATIQHFGKYSAFQLSRWSHLKGSPWYKASDGGVNLFSILSDDDIKQYFNTKVLA